MYIYVRMYVNITYVIVTATRCYSIGGLPDDLCINLHNGQYTYYASTYPGERVIYPCSKLPL